jgi:glycogen debranching enzyme
VNGLDVSVDTPAGSFPLSSQRYDGQVVHPESFRFIRSFTTDPWPTWRLHLLDGTVIEHELFMPRFQPTVVLSWRVCDGGARRRQKREARRRSVEPLTRHLRDVGLNHVSEVADAEAPHMPRGCPFQAWSVAELLRLDAVLAAPVAKPLDASLHPMCG